MTDPYNVGSSQDPQTQALLYTLRQKEASKVAEIGGGSRVTPHSLWDKGVTLLESLGVFVDASGQGASYGADFYHKHTPEYKGIDCPDWFKPLKAIDDPAELDGVGKEFAKKSFPELYEFWSPMFLPQGGEPPIAHYIKRMVAMKNRSQTARWGKGVKLNHTFDPAGSISGERAESPKTWVPEREWFKEGVFWEKAKNEHGWEPIIHFRDIFTLFPEAESQILKLLLGRLAIGPKGHIPPNWEKGVNEGRLQPVAHTARMAVIVKGDAGLGKSMLFQDGLVPAITALGFKVSTFDNTGSRFGSRENVVSNFSYKDDTSPKSIGEFLRAEQTKIAITGGTLTTEEKHMAAEQTVARTVFLLNANSLNLTDAYDLDEGIISRVKICHLFNESQLKKEVNRFQTSSLKPSEHLKELAAQLDVDQIVLFWWALRLAAEYFWHLISDTSTSENKLHSAVNYWSNNLRIQFSSERVRQLLKASLLCQALAWKAQGGDGIYSPSELDAEPLCGALEALFHVLADPKFDDLKEAIKADWDENGRAPLHWWAGFRQIRVKTLQDVVINRELLSRRSDAPFSEKIKAIMSKLAYHDGSRPGAGAQYMVEAWNAARDDAEATSEYADELLQRFPEVAQYFDPQYTTDCSRLKARGYDPKKISGSAIVKANATRSRTGFFENL